MRELKKKMGFYKINGKEMDRVKGRAGNCFCACHYANCGGSSSSDNYAANDAGDLTSIGTGC